MPTEAAIAFVLELLRVRPLDNLDHDWFFSDWANDPPRSFGERLYDLLASRASSYVPEAEQRLWDSVL